MRQEILEVAINQMKAGGYEALSFRLIAEGLDISKANVHHHFKNKEALAVEVINSYMEQNFTNFQTLAQQCEGDLVQFLVQAEDLFWMMSREMGHCGVCVCDQIARDINSPEILRELAFKHTQNFFDVIRNVVMSAYKSKQIKQDLDPEEVATHVNMMMNGMMNLSQNFFSVDKAEEELRGSTQSWVKLLLA